MHPSKGWSGLSGFRQQQQASLYCHLISTNSTNISFPAPASVNPPLVDGEGGEEEGADVEVDKAQAQDGKVAKVPVDKMSYIFYHSCRIIV